nr:UbiE/COQ5 family methyltransferase [Streptococcus thermophilus]
MAKANLEKNPHDVAGMFDDVGKNYDITNTVMTAGLDRRWRRRTRELLDLKPGERVLDLAAGTAVSTEELAKSGAWCVACDFSQGMLAAGAHRDVPKVVGDAMHLPFADETFDAVTISYGLRNVHDFEAGLREMARVTKPGGRLVVNEFSTPVIPVFSTIYSTFLPRMIPLLGKVFSSNAPAYEYLAESIKAWPAQEQLANAINDSGWERATWKNLALGIVALHRAEKA